MLDTTSCFIKDFDLGYWNALPRQHVLGVCDDLMKQDGDTRAQVELVRIRWKIVTREE